ncbi:hypothetical protein HK414_06640 [Ramlibacter terrae]|uniref:Uncharacterized protein n=1 Tax=Ramlibacter terrae TaxID=2732511 RepID=A0ABX6P369_9BURK|nr:hypothetical protein HK414_06640 [Ramlibacter terrae]
MVELRLGEAMPIEPLGLLRPDAGLGAGATLFSDYLAAHFGGKVPSPPSRRSP